MARKKEPKSATDLLDNPLITDDGDNGSGNATPFDKAYTVLTTTTGNKLELMTRTTPKLAQAIGVGYNMMFNFRSTYIRGRLDTLMRIHVSMGGKGRAEMVQSLQAGSGVPGEYYDASNPTLNSYVDMDAEEGEPSHE